MHGLNQMVNRRTGFASGGTFDTLSDEMQSFPVAAALFAAAFLPAVLEETAFRGIVLSELNGLGIKKAALISGFFFAVMHMDLQQFLYAFLVGFLFAYMVRYTRSVLAVVISHFTVNASAVFIGYAAPAAGGGASFPLIPALLVSVPALIFAARYFLTHNKNRFTEEIPLEENDKKKRILTWEFWAVCVAYLAIVLAG